MKASISIELDDFHRIRQMKDSGMWTLESTRWNYARGEQEFVKIAEDGEPMHLASVYIGLAAGQRAPKLTPEQLREYIRQMNTEFTAVVMQHMAEQSQRRLGKS